MPYATPEEAIRAKFVATAGINTPTGGRINPQLNTQEPEFPLLVFKRLGGAAGMKTNGASRLARYVFQADIYAATEAAAAAIAAAVDDALFGSGGWRDTANGVHGAVPDDSAQEATDDPYRVWTRVFAIWFQAP